MTHQPEMPEDNNNEQVPEPIPTPAPNSMSPRSIHERFLLRDLYRKSFWLLSIILLFIIPILSFDSGITDDDGIENEHGVHMMNYYLGKDTSAISSPIDEQGEWILKTRPYDYAANKNIYGGFFDMTCAFIYKGLTRHMMGEYESKHFLGAITGVLLLILTGLIAFQLTGSWAVALLALLFASLSPRIIGHSFNNPKDIPFAAAFTFGMYQIILLLQQDLRVTWKRAILLIIAIIISIDIRVGGLMLIVYMLSFVWLLMVYKVFILNQSIKPYVKSSLLLIAVSVAAYLGASLFWPWASTNPLTAPLITLRVFSQFNQFNSIELFEGIRINNNAIPWYFVVKWFYISFPIFFVSGAFLFFALWRWQFHQRFEFIMPTIFVVYTVVVTLALLIVQHSNVYDDARHLYFIVPCILVLCAMGWYWFIRMLPSNFTWPAIILCLLTMLEPLFFMMRNHPHEAIYFSPAINGAKGAFKQYEMDYWGFSLKAALKWIDNTDSVQAPGRKTRVRLWYGEQLKIKYYCDKSKHLEYALAPTMSTGWDYWLELPAESKHLTGLLENWPPQNTIHEITMDGVPLCAIVRNPLTMGPVAGQQNPGMVAPPPVVNPNDHMGQGMAYYSAKDYNKAIVEFKLLIAADSTNKVAYNNIVASYNLLGMYQDAYEIGSKVLKRYSDFTLLKNNLAVSQQGLKELKPDLKYYTATSYNYYVQGEFQMSIIAAQNILRFEPKSAAAYNNICSSNNALGRYKEAKAACAKALEYAPGDQLVKNNMAVAEKGMSGK